MIGSRRRFFVYARVARAEPDGEAFDDAGAGHPVERRLNQIEWVAAGHHAQIGPRSGRGMMATFGSAGDALLGACEMQRRCAVLPPIPSMRLVLRIGIHRGTIRQRLNDADDDGAGIIARLIRADDDIVVSRDMLDGLDEDFHRFAHPLEALAADTRVFAIDWREISPDTHSGESILSPSKRARTAPRLRLQLGLKTLELSKRKPAATIGLDPENDLTLTDTRVSRRHCWVECSEKAILLTDSSAGGTTIVTENKQEILVRNGSVALSGNGMIFPGRPFMGERRGGIRYESS
ncbi:MAG: FHA domain-containing protein [Candidatus Accumulibacter sp.]|nr:FHA domain-containing protein [Accumulibacter sp.]